MLLDASHHLLAILGIAHGRGGTGTEMLHVIQIHEFVESLHHVHHHALAFFGYLAKGEDILTQTQWNANKQ